MTSRLETNVLRVVNPHLATVRDGSVKQNLIRSIDLIGKALQPSHVTTNFVLTKRGDLLKHMQVSHVCIAIFSLRTLGFDLFSHDRQRVSNPIRHGVFKAHESLGVFFTLPHFLLCFLT